MIKYDIVLLATGKEMFLHELQSLGLVDITVREREPDERELELIESAGKHGAAVRRLRAMAARGVAAGVKPYADGDEAWHRFLTADRKLHSTDRHIRYAEKEIRELEVWGTFDARPLRELELNGVEFKYFRAHTRDFETHFPRWSERYTVVPMNEHEHNTYFVVVAPETGEIDIDAQEIDALTTDYRVPERELTHLREEKKRWTEELERAAASLPAIEKRYRRETERLDFTRVSNAVAEEAEGTLAVMEGWATRATTVKVDRFLEEYPSLVHLKSEPTPDDDTPVAIRNRPFARTFELIGDFYSLPRYGTTDLTPFFAPFYMLFFGLCMADAGYGLLFVAAGITMIRRARATLFRRIGKLILYCGIATVVCGAFLGMFFGIPFVEHAPFTAFRRFVLSTDNLFMLSLAIGLIQILLAMCLNVYTTTRAFGFRYALSTLGWLVVVITGLYAAQNSFELGILPYNPAVAAAGLSAGLFMMLFLNSPGKNPLVNLGTGLWNAYNSTAGLFSDALSYVRLFAIGLAGGVLALAFNELAVGFSPDIPVLKQLVMAVILTIGHGLNLFMVALSSFVHPMRLTFVEFYKNAGFQPANRKFTPFGQKDET